MARLFLNLTFLCFLVGCMQVAGAPISTLQDDEEIPPYAMGELPSIFDTGLYAENSMELNTAVVEYNPRFPLYSDTLDKRRYITLPVDSAIDATDLELWNYPVGTKLWKEFRLGQGDGSRILETRFMEKRERQWIFATYIWNEEQTEALLWDGQAIVNAAEVRIPGSHGDQIVQVAIPSYDQCLTCHIQHGANTNERPDPVLGFTAFQLEMQKLAELRDNEQLTNIRMSRNSHNIPARNDVERDVIGYLHANCGHCHNPRRPEFVQPTLSRQFVLDYNIASVRSRDDIHLMTLINQPIFNRNVFLPGVPPNQAVAIKPGQPNQSMLYHRMARSTGAEAMPKIGIASRDLDFVDGKLRRWIQTLPTN